MTLKSEKRSPAEAAVVYLVGFMGAGKSAVGFRLAELLGWSFIDLDRDIAERERMPISEIFRQKGEHYFRLIERQALLCASGRRNAVIALGGGAFCSVENQEIVARSGISVWLDAPLELLTARCGTDPASRPLFSAPDEMAELLKRRQPFYAAADLHLSVVGRSADDLAREILLSLTEQ